MADRCDGCLKRRVTTMHPVGMDLCRECADVAEATPYRFQEDPAMPDALRAARANRTAALVDALPILALHQRSYIDALPDGTWCTQCTCGDLVPQTVPNGLNEAMAQHQIDAVRGGK